MRVGAGRAVRLGVSAVLVSAWLSGCSGQDPYLACQQDAAQTGQELIQNNLISGLTYDGFMLLPTSEQTAGQFLDRRFPGLSARATRDQGPEGLRSVQDAAAYDLVVAVGAAGEDGTGDVPTLLKNEQVQRRTFQLCRGLGFLHDDTDLRVPDVHTGWLANLMLYTGDRDAFVRTYLPSLFPKHIYALDSVAPPTGTPQPAVPQGTPPTGMPQIATATPVEVVPTGAATARGQGGPSASPPPAATGTDGPTPAASTGSVAAGTGLDPVAACRRIVSAALTRVAHGAQLDPTLEAQLEAAHYLGARTVSDYAGQSSYELDPSTLPAVLANMDAVCAQFRYGNS